MPQSVEIKKVADTPQARACWLLQFCQRDLTQLTGQALEQLQSEWVEFQENIWQSKKPPAHDRLLEWQKEMKGKLDELKKGQSWGMDCGLRRTLKIVNGRLKTQRWMNALTKMTYPLPTGTENPYLIRVMDALEAVANDLKLCARVKCQKMFVRSKRQTYCSARCRGTEGKRKYRQKNK